MCCGRPAHRGSSLKRTAIPEDEVPDQNLHLAVPGASYRVGGLGQEEEPQARAGHRGHVQPRKPSRTGVLRGLTRRGGMASTECLTSPSRVPAGQ